MNNFKRKGNKLTMVAMLGLAVLFACNSPKKLAKTMDKMEIASDPKVLEVHGDSVLVTLKGKFPPKSFNKKAVVKVQPVLRYGGDKETPLKPLYLKGEKVKNMEGKVVNYSKGGSFTYQDKVEYTPAMKHQNLTVDYNIKIGNKYQDLEQCQGGSKDSASIGTITTSLSVKPTDDLYFYKAGKLPEIVNKVTLYYVINESKIRDSVMKGPAVAKLRGFLNDKQFKFKNIALNSYASPDGELMLNKNLTVGRAKSADDLLRKELKRAGLKVGYDTTLIQKPDNGEDWAGLKQIVMQRDFAGKQEVMDILNSNINDDDKEAKLRKTAAWNTLKNDLLPRLRRTEIVFGGGSSSKDLPTLMKESETSYAGLTGQELLTVAANTQDSNKVGEIYKYYMDNFPNEAAGANNYAAWMVKRGKYQEGDAMFQSLLQKYPNNDTIKSNYGVARRMFRNYDRSRNLYHDAANHGIDESNNLGILYIKYGQYDSSINSFRADRCDYNTALAYTLKGDYETALNKVECIQDKTADVFYLRSIIAARKGDRDLMTTSLTRAIELDPSIRDRAKDDLEFLKYRDADSFKNAIR